MHCWNGQRRIWLLAALTVILCAGHSANGFTGFNIDALTTQLRLFGYEIASLFAPNVAVNDNANKLRARLALPKRSYNYNGWAHPYRRHDYVREEQQSEMQRLQAEGRRWKLRNTSAASSVSGDSANISVDQQHQPASGSDNYKDNTSLGGLKNYFRRFRRQIS